MMELGIQLMMTLLVTIWRPSAGEVLTKSFLTKLEDLEQLIRDQKEIIDDQRFIIETYNKTMMKNRKYFI